MHSRLSIFSSRVLGSALVWTVLAIALIEGRAGRVLPARHPAHAVDRILSDLDRGRVVPRDTLLLGDSVGLQLQTEFLRDGNNTFVPLASNGAIEGAGQFYFLQRYLEKLPAPRRVVLLMLRPASTKLENRFTENYVQRCFLRWREIWELSRTRRSLPFGLVMAGYKLCPTFRYRLALQKSIPGLQTPDPAFGTLAAPDAEEPPAPAKHGLFDVLARRLAEHRKSPKIREAYFHRFAALLEARGIAWACVTPPLPESARELTAANNIYGIQMRKLSKWQARYPALHLHDRFQFYPDNWFGDRTHPRSEHLPAIAAEYAEILASMGFGLVPP